MSPYREPSKPAESNRFIELPVTRVRRFMLGPALWFLAVWFFVFVLAGIVALTLLLNLPRSARALREVLDASRGRRAAVRARAEARSDAQPAS